jgi:hypothetical protein
MRMRLAILLTIAAAGCGCDEAAPATAETPAETVRTAPADPAAPTVVREGLPALTSGPLVVDPGGFALGIVDPKARFEVVATLHNSGPTPITITTVKSTCGCTVPQNLKGRVIDPGETIPFSTTFTAPAALMDKSSKILMQFNAGGQSQHVLFEITATVALAVRSEPPYLDALDGVSTGQVQVVSVDGRPFRILSAGGEPPEYADGFDPARDEPRNAYTLQWNVTYADQAACDEARYWWVIETDHPDAPLVPVEIRHDCTGTRRLGPVRQQQWFFTDYVALLGEVRAGRPVEADVQIEKLRGRQTLRVDAVESLSPDATAELVDVTDAPGDKHTLVRVRFTPRAGYRGLLYADVLIKTETGDQDLAFICTVKE